MRLIAAVALLLADALAADLPRQVAVDGGEALGDAFGGDVVEQNVEARERAHVGDAVAHLAGADHADLADGMRPVLRPRGTRHWPLPNFAHVVLFYGNPPRCSTPRVAEYCPISTAHFAEFGRQFRQRLIEIGNKAVICDLEDRRLFILVDGDDHLRILHTGQMLNGA